MHYNIAHIHHNIIIPYMKYSGCFNQIWLAVTMYSGISIVVSYEIKVWLAINLLVIVEYNCGSIGSYSYSRCK